MSFGDLIKTRRQQLGLTLEQVGNHCGVGKSTVRKWETGMIQNMRRDKIALLAQILRINPVDLIGVDADEVPPEDSEKRLLRAWRGADASARQYALIILESSQVEPKKEQNA